MKILSSLPGCVSIALLANALGIDPARAQPAIDTTTFANAVPVAGDIPGLYKWANSRQSDSAITTIVSPIEGQRFREGDSVFVTIKASGIAIGAQTMNAEVCGLANSADGQHTHVILDNDPYLANYKTGQPFFLGIARRGVHTLRVFASRSWHESIKSPGSFKSAWFVVGDTIVQTPSNLPVNTGKPLLTYSRPKGEYPAAQAKAIMVDFFLTNLTLSNKGHKVRLTVDGKSSVLTEWVPYLVTGLATGEHQFRLELIGPDGKADTGPFNTTERAVTIK